MDGLEGLKILETITKRDIPSDSISMLFIVILVAAGVALITSGISIVLGQGEVYALCIVISGLGLLLAAYGVWNLNAVEYTEYKVTPIEEKYFIDLTKYEIKDTSGEIITIRTNNK